MLYPRPHITPILNAGLRPTATGHVTNIQHHHDDVDETHETMNPSSPSRSFTSHGVLLTGSSYQLTTYQSTTMQTLQSGVDHL